MLNFCFLTPKNPCAEPRRLTYYVWQETQLSPTNRATRLEVSEGHQTWYHSIDWVWFPSSILYKLCAKDPPFCLPRWLSWLRHSAHRPERSAGGAGVQSPGRPVDFVFGFQGRML